MPIKGFVWSDEQKEKYFSSEKVQAHQENFQQMSRGPKPEAQREKMSLAKKGRKYSEEHRAHMAETQRFRHALKKEIQIKYPRLTPDKVWEMVREEMKND